MKPEAAPTSLLGPLASAEGVIFVILSLAIVGMSIFCLTRSRASMFFVTTTIWP